MRPLILIALMLLTLNVVSATEHYSFEHAEKLKPLIQWREYGTGAFDEAVKENKPIFLLLTAPSWCHWCQVYESEEYLFHPSVIQVINDQFIPVYVDADKRQDLTRKYLEGGWPSTTILTPSRERLFGFSGPRPPGVMVENLQRASQFVKVQGFASNIQHSYQEQEPVLPTQTQLEAIMNAYAGSILGAFDEEHGGFGTGQKFPQGRSLDFALDLYEITGEERWLRIVTRTLENQHTKLEEIETNYNLFDPVEGGFHRYGTQRDWTPPHYEKMLYDNARLLKAYAHLMQIEDNPLAEEVVEKTDTFLQSWYDKGFYADSDAYTEEEYFGSLEREGNVRVEKTKYTDWNSEAIITYLYLWQVTGNENHKRVARGALDFFSKEMVTEEGAFHYKSPEGKGLRGTLLDNSYLLLAFVEGYEVLQEQKYLQKAEQLAEYSLDNLYDWNSGGFFERNSPDIELYAPGENVALNKPDENGVMAYALLRLYVLTENPTYLGSGIKTIGSQLNNIGGLDRAYYYAKAAELIIEQNLLSEYEQHRDKIEKQEQEKRSTFWVNDLIQGNIEQSNAAPEVSYLFLVIIAILAGFLSFLSPCTLPILPAYLSYGFRASKQNFIGMTLAFFLGLSLVFTLLGMSATAIGLFLRQNITVFSQVAGIAVMLFGIYTLLGKGLNGAKMNTSRPTSYFSTFIFGAALGISWTPCVGPILVSILIIASAAESVSAGGIMLFFYSVGLALPLLFLSAYISRLDKKNKLWMLLRGRILNWDIAGRKFKVHTSSLVSGLLLLVLGYLIFSGTLYSINQYIATTAFQNWLYGLEEFLLGLAS